MRKASDSNSGLWSNRKIVLILGLVAALATLVVYLPALRNGFVDWDDSVYVYNNLNIRTIDLALLRWAFTSQVAALWHPLTLLSYAFDYAIWGLNPFGFHLSNIILHSINTGLVFLTSLRLFVLAEDGPQGGCKPPYYNLRVVSASLVTSLLFGLHPMHVESVVWVSERKDVLSTFFFLLSILVYLSYACRGSKKKLLPYALSLIFFMLALMSKPMAISLPLVLLIIDLYPLRRFSVSRQDLTGIKSAIIEKIPFFALMCVFALITLWAQDKGGALVDIEGSAFLERVSIAVRGYSFYLYKMLLPVKFAPFYGRYLKTSVLDPWFVLSLAPLLTITALCIYTLKRSKLFAALWLYYLITLGPVIGLVQVSNHAAADRYVYIPSVALFLLLGALAGYGIGSNRGARRAAVVAISAAILIVLAVLTVAQTAVWKDSVSLWSQEIKHYPVSEAYRKRARAYHLQGDYQRSIEDYTTIIEYDKGRGAALALDYYKRGTALQNMGLPAMAVKDFTAALAIEPKNPLAYGHRAEAYKELGEFEMAVSDLTKVIAINPGAAAYNNRGNIYKRLGEPGLAIEDFKRALELSPELAPIHINLASAYLDVGETDKAMAHMRKAAALGLDAAKTFLRERGLAY